MLKRRKLLFGILAGYGLICGAQTQTSSPAVNDTQQLKVVVAPPDESSDTVIAIPPDTSWKGSIAFQGTNPVTPVDSINLAEQLRTESSLNGLKSDDLHPWHIAIAYDEFDNDGDNVHSGVVEEFWAGPKKYKIIYKSDNLNQTNFGTEQGLFRLGDQRWPNRAETQVLAEVINPFSYATTVQGFRMSSVERTFGLHSLSCVVFENQRAISPPTQYCFDKDSSVLRYVRGEGWFQTVYNDIVAVEGHNIAREVEVTDGGKRYLQLHVKTIEALSQVNEGDFAPPADATNLSGKTITGVNPRPIKTSFPEWPNKLRQQHFSVTVDIIIGKDGHVVSAHATEGPSDAYKAAEATALKWIFQPYLVAGEPAEVETHIMLSNM
jgi:hypothetical protein